MLTEEQSKKFVLICKKFMPEYMRRPNDRDSISYNEQKDLYNNLYDYEDENLSFVFARLHYELNTWFEENQNRIQKKNNRYLTSGSRTVIVDINKLIKELGKFFNKINLTFNLQKNYADKLKEIINFISNDKTQEFKLPDEYSVLEDIIADEPIFALLETIKFPDIKFLIFGAETTKPDIVVKDVLDGNLKVVNDDEVLVYDGEMSDSILYKDFNAWWSAVSQKKYKKYKSSLNYIEQKIVEYYKKNYKQDNYPVLIPQVYLHYDPRNQKLREKVLNGKIFTFQRMDFLIIYKGKRVIIEIDGETHTSENNLEKYSKQCKYDRDMKFLGYDVFRLGGYELTHNFDVTVKEFFDELYHFLGIEMT